MSDPNPKGDDIGIHPYDHLLDHSVGESLDDPNVAFWYPRWVGFGRCTATSTTAEPRRRCRRLPIPGGKVCEFHGGKAPQVQKAATMRLKQLVEPAIMTYAELLQERGYPSTRLSTANAIMDRTGHEAVSKQKISGTVGARDEGEDSDYKEFIRLLNEMAGRK
jgi:hypothetical protein